MSTNFNRIKELSAEIVKELGIKEQVENCVKKTKNVLDATTTKANKYGNALKEVYSQEQEEKRVSKAIAFCKAINGNDLLVNVDSVSPLSVTINVAEEVAISFRDKQLFFPILEIGIEKALEEYVEEMKKTFNADIFNIVNIVFPIEFISDELLEKFAKKIANEEFLDLEKYLVQKPLCFDKKVELVHITKDMVEKNVEDDLLSFHIKLNKNKTVIFVPTNTFYIDTFNSLLLGMYETITMYYIPIDCETKEDETIKELIINDLMAIVKAR